MPDPVPHADRSGSSDSAFPDPITVRTREHVVVRRRRSTRARSPNWIARASMRRTLRIVAVCGGALLLMVAGLYFGLSHQDGG